MNPPTKYCYLVNLSTRISILLAILLVILLISGCSQSSENKVSAPASDSSGQSASASSSASVGSSAAASSTPAVSPQAAAPDEQPSTVFYEIFVRSFYDSNGDGIGDLKGITEKLDYLNDGNPNTHDDLGIGGIWLMPINPSPSYHGYDVTDYKAVNPDYGTMDDLKELLREAHKRGIKVIMDLVVNHTSDQNPWFIDSAKSKNSQTRDWYIWAEDQNRSMTGVSAASGGDPWVPLNGSHYLAGFSGSMPDLNFDNPDVRKEIESIGQFWLKTGMDGFRIDAAKHIYEDFTTDDNETITAKNVAWWQEFRSSMNLINPNAYIVGEIAGNSAAKAGAYLDKAFDSSFNFPLADSLISAAKNEKNNGLAFMLERTYKLFSKISGGVFTDAVFLSNHDQNRVMTALSNNVDHAKTAAAMLLTLPGNPFIYYGEEIGMRGSKPDEHIREPMPWYSGKTGAGQAAWEAALLNSGSSAPSVEKEQADADSLLSRYKTLIAWRNEIPALNSGSIQEFETGQDGVMAYYRITETSRVLVVHNLSGSPVTFTFQKDPGVGKLLKTTDPGAELNQLELTLPEYTTVVLQ